MDSMQSPTSSETQQPIQKEKSLASRWGLPIAILFGCLLLLGIGGYIGYFIAKNPLPPLTGQTACTMEAKICPDGSAVGRSGPNCAFAPCPNTLPTTNATPETPSSPAASSAAGSPGMIQTSYSGDGAQISSSDFGTFVVFKTCDASIAQCTYYLLPKNQVTSFPALQNVKIGNKILLSGTTKSRGVATGNIYLELTSNIRIEKE